MNKTSLAFVLAGITSIFILGFSRTGTLSGMATGAGTDIFTWASDNILLLTLILFGAWILILQTYTLITDRLLLKSFLDKLVVEGEAAPLKPMSERHLEPRAVFESIKKEPAKGVLGLFKK